MHSPTKIIISGGGTGGHVFPAIAIANALKAEDSEIEILFVGALGKIEMEKVPAAGYKIIGLPITGFLRKLSFRNFVLLFRLIKSLFLAKKIIKDFKPDVVVGVGGYASGPVLWIANRLKVPALIQEQNSYAGVTNKLLAKKAKTICVAYGNMERYFPKEKIIFTGNPVRSDLINEAITREEARDYFNFINDKPVVLCLGGSLGARTINLSIFEGLRKIKNTEIQFIWQTGRNFLDKAEAEVKNLDIKNLKVFAFINRMDLAFKAADVVISRAGASTISELCLVKKPCILVPSPNVAEDHQTKNAMALVNRDAAILVKDQEAPEILINAVFELVNNPAKWPVLAENIATLAVNNSSKKIALEVLKLKNS